MKTTYRSLSIAIPLFWCGMIAGISFLEAPLKFTAPGVTLPIGLSIGSIVFHAFNGVELCLLFIWLICVKSAKANVKWYVAIALLIIVGMQSCWLLPALELRATLIRNGLPVQGQTVHPYYVACEVLKFALLAFTGFSLLHKMQQRQAVPA